MSPRAAVGVALIRSSIVVFFHVKVELSVINCCKSPVLASLLVLGSLVASRAQDVFIGSGDRPPQHGWNTGSLEIRFDNSIGESQSVRISFSGESLGNLMALRLEAGDWRLDLSQYVTNLPIVLPHRITISTVLENDGRFHELVVDVPYRRAPSAPCMALELGISDGRVVDDRSFEIVSERCDQ